MAEETKPVEEVVEVVDHGHARLESLDQVLRLRQPLLVGRAVGDCQDVDPLDFPHFFDLSGEAGLTLRYWRHHATNSDPPSPLFVDVFCCSVEVLVLA